MSFSLEVRVVRARLPRGPVVLTLPLLPPGARSTDDWLADAAAHLKRQRAPRLMHPVDITIRLEDAHPRRDGAGCIAPVLALLSQCGVLQSDRAQSVRRVSVEWAPVTGVEITIRRAP
jgi:hypothetical protein